MHIDFTQPITLTNPARNPKRDDFIHRFEMNEPYDGALRITIEACTQRVAGPPGQDCMVFFNVEYEQGPIFWDTFLYPDTGSTDWHTHTCTIRPRGRVKTVEMHVRFHAPGSLHLRRVVIEPTDAPADDGDYTIAVFGDSTDMTCYLPTEHRLLRRFELLLRDRFLDHVIDVHNLAEGGEYLERLLDSGRLARDLDVLPPCDMIIVRYGLNDKSHDIQPADFARQLNTVCDMIEKQQPSAHLVLSTTIPEFCPHLDEQTIAVAAQRDVTLLRLDQYMQTWTDEGEWDWHHEPRSRFGRRRTENPSTNPTGMDGDKHPNAYGSQRIAEFYFAQLQTIIAAKLESPA